MAFVSSCASAVALAIFARRSPDATDEVIAAARSIQNNTERMAEYAALEKRLVQQDAVWVPLFSSDHLFVLGDRLERFTPFWAGWGDLYLRDLVLKPEAR